jgi:two-component sensor histidine kinase
VSVFSNPVGTAGAAADAYIAALLKLLGDQDPLAIQERLIESVKSLTAGLTPEQLLQPEAAGKWCILEVLAHLADQELVNSYRLRAIVAEDEPLIQGYDQDRWAARLRYRDTEPAELLRELEVLRKRNLRLYRQLSDAELDRVGIHSERGRESARRLRSLTAAHDLVHRRQIERIRTAVRSKE